MTASYSIGEYHYPTVLVQRLMNPLPLLELCRISLYRQETELELEVAESRSTEVC